jgi:CO/xanthine dehydrogenase FAD-binding subunit
MDLNTITEVERPRTRDEIKALTGAKATGDAWLAGGTWLFSEPQPRLRRLIDLAGLDWMPLQVTVHGLGIAATCTIATLAAFEAPAQWTAARLIGQCCTSFLASFKIWNMATVGGNLCMALPAGPMISLCVALEGVCSIWTPDGGLRQLAVFDFVKGPLQPALESGEVLRRIDLPLDALTRRTAFRRISLTKLGRSGALLIGTLSRAGALSLTVTASTRRPVRLSFAGIPTESEIIDRIAAEIPTSLYYDDIHGLPDWRQHMTFEFAKEIRSELAAGDRP